MHFSAHYLSLRNKERPLTPIDTSSTMAYETEATTSVSKTALSLDESLKQMRERRYSTLNKAPNGSDHALPMPSLYRSPSTFSQASEDESDQRIYWRRLGQNKKSKEALPMMHPRLSITSPTSVTSQFVEKVSKLEGLLDLNIPSMNASYNNMSNSSRRQTAARFGRYQDQAMELDYTPEDLQALVGGSDFERLKRTLRNKGAVTNEMLRQVLPLVVKQSRQEKQKEILARSLQ
jgi:hypothetical protein